MYKTSLSPIFLNKESRLTNMVVSDMHIKLSHSGKYNVISELRKQFYIPCIYSVVKKVLSDCILCRKLNARGIILNQSPYRDLRISPCNVPFRCVYLDFMGPFYVRFKNVKFKVWVLVITCMWSRAINLKVCTDMSTSQFLKALQTHIYRFG